MKLKEIVSCYVGARVSRPQDLSRLRQSFIDNGFSEKEISSSKWCYKRGSPVALEFDYNSDALEIQIVITDLGNELDVSVGNWGFPFEPLMSKNRYKATLASVVEQIAKNGELEIDSEERTRVADLSMRKRNLARKAFLAAAFLAVASAIISIIQLG